MALDETTNPQNARADYGPISWWSWRPGIRPLSALAIGGTISLLALAIVSLGLVTLAAGERAGALLILAGLALLAYPALLARWGWRDLLVERYQRDEIRVFSARVVALRAASSSRKSRSGVMPRGTNSWHGVALLPINSDSTPRALTFSVSEELYRSLREGMQVRIKHSPHLRFVYALEPAGV
ncbi:MAG TPA: hypothetical protein VKV37_19200 [Ktedonobacteraceae bacterium]|jgi:hypothetical protein|nr:hypothetical protein [Ktedonobacteraceae bacterium]